ncbi:MAG: hypothetical protein AAGH76_06380 [Pseudomonadota bacterium]
MSINETVSIAFGAILNGRAISDEQIRSTQNPMELREPESLLRVVPCYIQYCIDYPQDDSLVAYCTINAIAEYGRCKDPSDSYLNFKFLCNEQQRLAVAEFLVWANGPPHFEDETQIRRAVRNWRKTHGV